MTYREVILAIDGLRDKDLYNQHLTRRSSFIIASSGYNAKNIVKKFDKLWPMEGEVKNGVGAQQLAMLKQFKEQEQVANAMKEIKNGRRS